MSVPVWPAELPRPNRSGFSRSKGETRRITKPDQGPPRTRRARSKNADTIQMTITVSRDGLAVFDAFFEDVLGGGSLPFLMADPETDDWPLLGADGVALTDETGQPLLVASTWVCMFGEQLPVSAPAGVEWQVSFGISVMPS